MSLTVEPRADNSLIADATVQLESAAPLFLEFGNAQLGWLRTPTSAASTTHRLGLVRMRPQTSYQVRAFALREDGCAAHGAQAEFTTDELPDVLKSLNLTTSGRPTSPLTLMDLHFISHNGRHALLAVDQDAQPVWYYLVARQVLRDAPDSIAGTVIRLTNGDLLYLLDYYGPGKSGLHMSRECTPVAVSNAA